MKQRVYKTFTAYLWLTLASAVYALGFNWCYAPNLIGFGGITAVKAVNRIKDELTKATRAQKEPQLQIKPPAAPASLRSSIPLCPGPPSARWLSC